MRTLRLMTLSCLLTACSAGVTPMPDPSPTPPPPNLTMAPEILPQPLSGKPKDLEANHRDVTQAYHRLAAQVCGLLAYGKVTPIGCMRYLEELETRANE